ncbi:hypothetical protein GLYMA_08G252202v4 [Glycine max]|nr:hypothetical protein GLYMA_08G252202v4 [Glycine max]KAH1053019.1 hypothetical protein GYH30_022352 [Glycine max]|eukprot:XP_006586457.1 uncharacterized protein LOC102663892 [Glycine max]
MAFSYFRSTIFHFPLRPSCVAPSHDKLLLIANDFYAESIDIDSPLLMCALRLILPPTSPPYRDQYDEVDHRGKLEILGSCRGLILLYYDRSCDLILWNPSIGVHRISPKFKCGLTLVYLYGFGYDTSSDDYLLILIGLLDEYKYDYYDDESKDNEYKVDYQILSFNSFNETLHWLVFSTKEIFRDSSV